jgi:hypothetical protein
MSFTTIISSSTKAVKLNILKIPVRKSITFISGSCCVIINSKSAVASKLLIIYLSSSSFRASKYHQYLVKVIGVE